MSFKLLLHSGVLHRGYFTYFLTLAVVCRLDLSIRLTRINLNWGRSAKEDLPFCPGCSLPHVRDYSSSQEVSNYKFPSCWFWLAGIPNCAQHFTCFFLNSTTLLLACRWVSRFSELVDHLSSTSPYNEDLWFTTTAPRSLVCISLISRGYTLLLYKGKSQENNRSTK